MTQMELSRTFGVSKTTINAIRAEYTWTKIEPRILTGIPKPFRKYSDQDYLDMRQLWRDGWTLKQLAAKYDCRADVIQSIISGKRGKRVPVGERVMRPNKTKLGAEARQEMLRRHLAGETQIALAKEYGMSKNGISLALQKISLALNGSNGAYSSNGEHAG